MEQLHDCFVEVGAGGLAILGAGDVAHMNLDAASGGTQVDRGLCREGLHAVTRGGFLPFFFGLRTFSSVSFTTNFWMASITG